MLDADAVINHSSQKVGGSNAYPDPAPKKVGAGSGPRKTHRIYAPGCSIETVERIGPVLAWELLSTLCCKKIQVPSKIRVLPSGTLL